MCSELTDSDHVVIVEGRGRCISFDLNKKMHLNWQLEPLQRYKQLLAGAFLDGEVCTHSLHRSIEG